MNWWQKSVAILRALFRKEELDAEMSEEMHSHIEMQTLQNIELGMEPEAARNAALREFGWVESVKETCREQRGIQLVETLIQDIRFAGRMLWKKPSFTVVVVLTLALGIGTNTAIFSVVNAVLLKPLPYRAPDRIVMLWANNPTLKVGTQELPVEALDLPEWRAQAKSFETIAAFRPSRVDISGQGAPERLAGVQVTASLFPLLGVKPILGRTFTSDEEQPGNDKVAVISHALWIRRFGGDESLVGQRITINGERQTVLGVMPPGFSFPRGAEMPSLYALLPRTEVWLPLAEGADFWHHDENRVNRSLIALARIRPNVSPAQAQSELNIIASRQAKEHPTSHSGWTVVLRSLPLQASGETRPMLFMLFGVVTQVALIACANLASLFLCRSSARGREMAVRAALGAGRARVVRQLLTESLIFSALGGAVGLLFGTWGIRALLRFSPTNIPRLDEVSLDGRVLAFTALVAALTGISFGLLPALSASRVNLSDTLKTESRTGAPGKRHRAHGLLVAGEVAFALVLLAGAGLLLKSFLRLSAVAPGFPMEAVVSDALARPRFSALLLSLFAVAALMLTIVGVYGVVSFAAQQRTHEIGIRIAVGASLGNILALVLREGMWPVIAGLVIGLFGALGLTRFLATQLYAVKPTDPVTFLAVIAVLAFVALLACWVPARRAMRIDPIKALRCE